LLTLAHREPAQKRGFAATNLSEADGLAIADVVPLADAKGTEVEFDAKPDLQIEGDHAAFGFSCAIWSTTRCDTRQLEPGAGQCEKTAPADVT